MTSDEAIIELDKIADYAEQLTGEKKLSIVDIMALMARMQCSQVRLIMFLMDELGKLK